MERINLTIEIKAKGKGRPRFVKRGNFVSTYTPKETVDFCNIIRNAFIEKYGDKYKDYEGAIRSCINIFYAPPKSTSEKKKKELLYEPFLKKPDIDNIEKSIYDALNGVAYKDDCQIYECSVMKKYNDKDFIVIELTYENL